MREGLSFQKRLTDKPRFHTLQLHYLAHAWRPSLNCILELAIWALKSFFSPLTSQRERYKGNAKNDAHSTEIKISFGNEVRVDQTFREQNHARRNVAVVQETPQ